ncbi:uncharacterized protein [Watersipora subatra]|uniref:uncharacterized protein n=1 Tax=Watersipora subatra TaxID=2589382 RepID=UPI00355BEE69
MPAPKRQRATEYVADARKDRYKHWPAKAEKRDKVMVRFIENRLRDYDGKNNTLPNTQHGFRKNNKASTYLTEMITTIKHQRKKKQSIPGMFLNLQKVFDRPYDSDEIEADIERVFLGEVQDNQNYSNLWMKSIDVHMGEPESETVSVKFNVDSVA